MMTTDTKDLIDKARRVAYDGSYRREIILELADALERLTQPAGVEPVAYMHNVTNELSYGWDAFDNDNFKPLYSAEQFAQLQVERDELKQQIIQIHFALKEADRHPGRTDDLLVDVIGDMARERNALQEQVKTLQRLVRNSTEFRLGVPEYEALAATGKGKTEC